MIFSLQAIRDLEKCRIACSHIKVFFVYCKIQKRAEVRSFPYRYLYRIGIFTTSSNVTF